MIPAGFLLIDKIAGPSSFETLKDLRKILYSDPAYASPEAKRFVRDLALGHCGTLDPFATGLLLVAVGRATRLTQYFLGGDKTYSAILKFGERTKSGDLTDPVIEAGSAVPSADDGDRIARVLRGFVETPYFQAPPMSSAKKVGGRKLYEIERAGGEVHREALAKRIVRVDMRMYEAPELEFVAEVESGTYIRTLGEDIARALGTIGHLRELRRLRSSRFSVDSAVRVADVGAATFAGAGASNREGSRAGAGGWSSLGEKSAFIPFDHVFGDDDGVVTIDAAVERALRFGQQDVLGTLGLVRKAANEADSARDFVPLRSQTGALVGIARYSEERAAWRTDVVFPVESVVNA